MGWVGLGALVASVSYILYKHPPAFWTLAPWWHRSAASASSRSTLPAENLAVAAEGEKPSERAPLSLPEDDAGAETGRGRKETEGSAQTKTEVDSESDASQELTPKAVAAAPPTLKIPMLSLNTDTSTNNEENRKRSQPKRATQTIPVPPTLQPPAITTSSSKPLKPSSSGPKNNTLMPPPTLKPQNVKPLSNRPPTSDLMPPPLRPSNMSSLRAPPSIASSLRGPPARAPSTSTLAPPISVPGRPAQPSRQVILEPGHSPLDWAALSSDPRNNLRGADLPATLVRVTPSVLKLHNGRKGRDAWTSYRRKVYNITPYIPFHPGGKGEILRGAGKDSERLFMEAHPWVNWEGMLGECLVGILVGENDAEAQSQSQGQGQSGGWDDMD